VCGGFRRSSELRKGLQVSDDLVMGAGYHMVLQPEPGHINFSDIGTESGKTQRKTGRKHSLKDRLKRKLGLQGPGIHGKRVLEKGCRGEPGVPTQCLSTLGLSSLWKYPVPVLGPEALTRVQEHGLK
jgi:hypothetical protein